MQIQTPKEFFQDLIFSINKAKKTIFLQSMNFESGIYVDQLASNLIASAKKGIKIRLEIDWVYQHFNHGDVPIFFRTNRHDRKVNHQIVTRTNLVIRELMSAGIDVVINNQPMFPLNYFKIFGRDHKKIYCVDSEHLWLGGVNLFDEAFENKDLMLKLSDKRLIKHFVNLLHDSKKNEKVFDFNNERFIFDRGNIFLSPIYNRAMELIESAESSILFVSQFVPDDFTFKKLTKKSKQGVQVTVFTSNKHDRKFTSFFGKHFYKKAIKCINKSNIQLIHDSLRVHTKLLVIDSKKFIIGSHNLVFHGNFLATEEVAIEIKNETLAKKVAALSLSQW